MLVEDLCYQIKELLEEFSGLCSIRNRLAESFRKHCSLKSQALNFAVGLCHRVCLLGQEVKTYRMAKTGSL